MDLRVHMHTLYKCRYASPTTTNGYTGRYTKTTTYVAQYEYWLLPRVYEHTGSSATHLSLVAHQTLSIDMLTHGLYVTKGSTIRGSSSTIFRSYMYGYCKVYNTIFRSCMYGYCKV